MAINFANIGGTVGGTVIDLTGPNWTVGVWVRGNGTAGGAGHVWNASVVTGADYPTQNSQNNNLGLFDTGNTNAAITQRRRWLANGTDSAGVRFGPTSYVDGSATLRGIQSKQYETGETYRELLTVHRRNGTTSELWRTRPGQVAELLATATNAFAGFSAKTGISFGASRYQVTTPYDNSIDAPFHFSDKSLTAEELTRIGNGESPNTIDQTLYARGAMAFISSYVSGQSDLATAYNPVNGSTITLNGTVITFVTSGAVGNQVNINTTAALTVADLVTFLNASADVNLSVATYSSFTSTLFIKHKTAGAVGATYTLAKSVSGIQIPTSASLGFVDWCFTALSQTGPSLPAYGGGYMYRTAAAWGAAVTAIADTTPKPNAVTVDPMDSGRVIQHVTGFADITMSGRYVGAAPFGVLVTLLNAVGGAEVKAETELTNFTASGGTWSGTLPHVAKGKRWLNAKFRKTGGTDFTQTETLFGVGEIIEIAGQSLGALWQSAATTVTPNGFSSMWLSNDYSVVPSGTFAIDNSWHRQITAAESMTNHAALGNILSEQADCVVGFMNRCMGGTNIATINSDSQWLKRAADVVNSKCGTVGRTIWIHGHADAGSGTYTADLDSLLAKVHLNYGASARLGILLESNIQQSVDQTAAIWGIRKVQRDWVESRKLTDATVFSAGQITDLDLPADGVHPSGTQSLKMPDRVGRAILYDLGISAISGDGPKPVAATRNGAVIDITFAMEGGAVLTTVGGAAPTGLDLSKDGFTSILAITSTAIVLPDKVRVTLAADPGQDVDVMYLWGRPGNVGGDTGRAVQTQLWSAAQAVPLYDDSVSLLGLGVGKPAQGTYTALSTGAAQVTILRTTPLLMLMTR